MTVAGILLAVVAGVTQASDVRTGVLFDGWYADPLICRYADGYWIYPSVSDFQKEIVVDAFHSADLKTWTKHPKVLTTNGVAWARCLWAPHAVEKDGRYYLFFGANDPYPVDRKGGDFTPVKEVGIQKYGGIGVAVADRPEGPYEDLIGKPLIDQFWNKAQPIDQYVFDWKGAWYMVYGGWDRCTLVRLAPDFKSILPWPDGSLWRDLTQPGYKEGPVMFERKGVWYFMYSSGTWSRDDYCIKYCMGPSPLGPFAYKGKILGIQRPIATGAGHHSVLCLPGTDDWFICYHRRPIPNLGKSHRVVCLDRMRFSSDGSILPVVMTDGERRDCSNGLQAEGHVRLVVDRILDNVRKIRSADSVAVPMAFWDFDGTIIKGDSGFGLTENGEVRYRGLIQEAIEAGFVSRYRTADGYRRWQRDYERMAEIGAWLSQGYDAQMFAGASAAELDAFCERKIRESRMTDWYYASSVAIWKALSEAGVENYVVSANVEALVRNVSSTLGVPPDRVRGARVELEGGRWTTRLVQPIPHGEGKAEIVRGLVCERPHGVAIAAFGNSCSTDGAFLRHVAEQTKLPGGAKGTAVMINGRCLGLDSCDGFMRVEQKATVGRPSSPAVF